jgi:hypothetical protein
MRMGGGVWGMGGACHLHGHHVHFQIWRHCLLAAGLKGRLMVTPQMDKY